MKFIKLSASCLAFAISISHASGSKSNLEWEKWWENTCRDKKIMEEVVGWWGNENAISRILARLHIVHAGYQSILDVGCGMCVDYVPFKRNIPNLIYQGIDIAPVFIERAHELDIPAQDGRVQKMPFANSSFDVVYARHLLEHLDTYKDAIKEMVRVAAKEVLIVFFSVPADNVIDKISMMNVNGHALFQNRYSKAKLEAFLKTLDKVKSFTWQVVKNRDEAILHLMVE